MLKLPDKAVDLRQLSRELHAAGLSVTGVARLSRQVNENGRAVLEGGRPKQVAPYLLVKGDVGEADRAAINAVVTAHVPIPPEAPDPLARATPVERALAKQMGLTDEQFRSAIEAEETPQ